MNIISLIKLDKGRSKICLDNGTDFVLYKGEIKRFHIEEGAEITEATYELIKQEIIIPRCKKRALHLLEKQDRTEANVRTKLREGGYPDFAVEEAIAYLYSYHYLDDERYALNYIRFHQETKSRVRIKQDLLAKGISASVVDICLEEEYSQDESQLIKELLQKKGYDTRYATVKDQAKMYRFLASRGFSSSAISKAIKGFEDF